ncbi:hypothetical protein EVG20_g472 [Dentipellis fragilis]|uniref:F-box domain-containing protein n=1 Tax=Dentipellis fragilis TaxID=205917 RepID=A0A4Y9ZEE1_9AGAM|nr:hypothetical protein EVG20_g472 [Dentipellis fragilis]
MQTDVEVVQRTPPEIWLSISEHATFVPHAFDTDVADPFDVPGAPIPFDTSVKDNLRSSIVTKRSLVLVCKLWHDLADPLLYQAVAAEDNHGLKCLRNTLYNPRNLSPRMAAPSYESAVSTSPAGQRTNLRSPRTCPSAFSLIFPISRYSARGTRIIMSAVSPTIHVAGTSPSTKSPLSSTSCLAAPHAQHPCANASSAHLPSI